MTYLIKNGRVIDPLDKIDDRLDVLISGGKVASVGKNVQANGRADVIDAQGKIVAPGLVDMHVHLREPGREDKETIATGTRAALKGGITAVAAMPNTEPPIDSPEMVKRAGELVRKKAVANVFIVGAITRRREGKELTDIEGMKRSGIVAISDDGSSVEDGKVMRSALKEASAHSVLLISHCDDKRISGRGVINAGYYATALGLRGIPKSAEYEFVRRDIELAKKLKARLHIAHVSCRESCALIRSAKRSGVPVTAETAPHYFMLTEECCATYDTNTKMNPPLRTKDDIAAIRDALADGTIDAIASDHAPHGKHDKDVEFDKAAFGIIGLETSLALSVTGLVEEKVIDWPTLIMRMSCGPARILGITRGSLKKGSAADITIIDPSRERVFEERGIVSKSKNSPFIGWTLKGLVTEVFVDGELRVKDSGVCV